ncbi:hypothetical protein PV326_007171 [Microctonus aethiopoides]|nr:hypothetical protein PV326_007171 [Microctonus aethiopoides]
MRVHKCIQLWVFMMIGCTLGSCSAGISCFKCTIAPLRRARNETIRICSKFEENSHYQIYCPNSTMCMKRTIHHKLEACGLYINHNVLGIPAIVQTSVERGCAPQLDVGKGFDSNAKSWYDKAKIVEEVYEEGCFVGEDRGSPGGPPEYCFCV